MPRLHSSRSGCFMLRSFPLFRHGDAFLKEVDRFLISTSAVRAKVNQFQTDQPVTKNTAGSVKRGLKEQGIGKDGIIP
ncbi:hypothetical protein GQ600_10743 [Phytophthora cactorum]|nr:hypothetical protein GQ600_10743 [Phytophthora cactorum]